MNFLSGIATALIAFSSLFFGQAPASPTLGGVVPTAQALFETSLQASITSNATTATLVSGTDLAGNQLSGYYCFTIDAGTVQNEFTCGNASGTALTNLVRGVNPALGITANTGLQFAHRRGAGVKITDAPYISLYSNIFNGTQGIPAVMSYDPALAATSTIGSNVNNIASVGYVNSVASSGAPDASFSQKGLIQLATTSQSLVGTATSSATTYLVVPNSAVNQSSTANKIPIANASGTIDPNYIPTGLNLTTTSTAPYLTPPGVIEAYSSSTAPNGWLLCNGQAVVTSTYPTLFALIGYTYGGSTSTFGLPNMGGRFIAGPSSTLSTTLGTTGGSTSTFITSATLPTSTIGSGVYNVGGGGNSTGYAYGPIGGSQIQTAPLGSGGALGLMNPYIIEQYIIKY